MKSKSVILSTAYLPPIEYFAYIIKGGKIYIEVHETFIKQTYRNRCKIQTANGTLNLSIPVSKVNGNHTSVKDIIINNDLQWQKDHWRAIESAYNASPYFEYYKDELENFYKKEYHSLIEFNYLLLMQVFELIGLKKEIENTKNFVPVYKDAIDLRNHFNPKKESHFKCPQYYQVFDDKHGFAPNLSIIDLLFMEGPNTLCFLQEISI